VGNLPGLRHTQQIEKVFRSMQRSTSPSRTSTAKLAVHRAISTRSVTRSRLGHTERELLDMVGEGRARIHRLRTPRGP